MKESNKWYDRATDGLKFEEIEGRIVVDIDLDGVVRQYPSYRYILIPLPEKQPLEFCGIRVHVVQNTPDNHFQWGFATKEDCERAWNEFIRRLK